MCFGKTGRELFSEFRVALRIGTPVLFAGLVNFGTFLVNTAFVGRSGTTILAAVAIGSTFANISGLSVAQGLMTALDTLCSQANGASNFRRVGLVYQRGLVVLAVLSVVSAALWGFGTAPLLILLKQDPEVARLAQSFTRVLTIGIVPQFAYEATRRTLVATGTGFPQFVAGASAIVSITALDAVFVLVLKKGATGSALALALTNFVQFAVLLAAAKAQGVAGKLFVRPSREALGGMRPFLRLAIPGMLMLCAEWWAFEGLLVLAGMIGPSSLSALSIIMTIMGCLINIPFSIGIVVSSRVGNSLGANDPNMAKAQAVMAVVLVACLEAVYLTALVLCRSFVGFAFSNDGDLVVLVAATLPYHIILSVFDGLQAVLSGVLRGCGLQLVGAIGNIATFYLLGIPLAAILVFLWQKQLGSIYLGFMWAPVVQSAIFGVRLLLFNWQKKADEISERESSTEREAGLLSVPAPAIALEDLPPPEKDTGSPGSASPQPATSDDEDVEERGRVIPIVADDLAKKRGPAPTSIITAGPPESGPD